VLAGYPVVDVKATLVDGSYHEVDSNEMAFTIAGSMAAKDGMQKGQPTLLEPIMKVEVVMPEEFMGEILGDLSSRRGQILGMEGRATMQVVRAYVPLGNMFGYATDLRSKTQGRAVYSMEFHHYQEVPKSIAEEIVPKSRADCGTLTRSNNGEEEVRAHQAARERGNHRSHRPWQVRPDRGHRQGPVKEGIR